MSKQPDLFDRTYPEHPGYVDHDTSLKAAASIAESVTGLRRKVWNCLDAAVDGLTCDQIEVILDMKHQTVSARIRELVLFSMVRDRGDRRLTRSGRSARVYTTTRTPVPAL